MNIFVGSLPFRLQEAELSKEFEKFGEVSSVKIITDKMTGRSKGFGFVEMPNDEQAQAAISALNGSQVGGRDIVVNQAQERKEGGGERRSFGGGNRGGGSSYGGGAQGGNRDVDYGDSAGGGNRRQTFADDEDRGGSMDDVPF